MADLKITALTENTTPVGTDLLPIVDDPSGTALTQKVTVDNLDTYLSSTTKTLTNKTIGDTLSIDGAITQTGTADHITLTPGTSKLVKFSVLRQNITTNTYSNNQIILTGWGFWTGDGSNAYERTAISFGVTFSSAPIVILGSLGYKGSTDPTAITDFATIVFNIGDQIFSRDVDGISTTGFNAEIRKSGALTNGWRLGFSWIAIGTL